MTEASVAVAGWFGSGNFGDELLLEMLCDLLSAHVNRSEIVVLCPQPQIVGSLHGLRAVPLPVLRGGSASDRRRTNEVIGTSRQLFYGPGTIFQERSSVLPWPGTIPMLLRLGATTRLKHTRLSMFGSGVREDLTLAGRGMLRTVGALCEGIGVRDDYSARTFGRRAAVIGDLAFRLPEHSSWNQPSPSYRTEGQLRVGLSVRPLHVASFNVLIDRLHEALRYLETLGLNPAFIPMSSGIGASGESDFSIHDEHFSTLPLLDRHFEETAFSDALTRFNEHICTLDLMVGMRLHAVVSAVMAGVPTVAIAYERKVAITFEQLGLGAFVVSPTFEPAEFVRVVTHAMSDEGRRALQRASVIARETADRMPAVLAGMIKP